MGESKYVDYPHAYINYLAIFRRYIKTDNGEENDRSTD